MRREVRLLQVQVVRHHLFRFRFLSRKQIQTPTEIIEDKKEVRRNKADTRGLSATTVLQQHQQRHEFKTKSKMQTHLLCTQQQICEVFYKK